MKFTIHLRRPWTSAFFRLASGTVGFSPRLKNSGHVITFLRRCGLQNTDDVMQPVSCFSRLCQSPEEGKMSFAQFKIFYGENFERCKMRRMKKERFQLITYQETIDYQLECMLLPLQFKLYMLELRGRSWTSRQSYDVFHQRRENSFTSWNKAQRPKQQNTCLLCRCSYRKNEKQ